MWEFGRSRHVSAAAKRHQCVCCGGVIAVGEAHTYFAGRFEGDFMDYRVCAPCQRLVDAWFAEGLDEGDGWPPDLRREYQGTI